NYFCSWCNVHKDKIAKLRLLKPRNDLKFDRLLKFLWVFNTQRPLEFPSAILWSMLHLD
ncbi:hypothetical protein VP01_10858g1, partial [Puccinia sorghi]